MKQKAEYYVRRLLPSGADRIIRKIHRRLPEIPAAPEKAPSADAAAPGSEPHLLHYRGSSREGRNKAWAFVRYMLENRTNSMELPACKTLLEKEAAVQMQRYHLFSLTGSRYSNSPSEPEYVPLTMVLTHLTEDHISAVMDLLENHELYVAAAAGADATVKSLIAEKLSACCAGSATAEDAVRRIQTRVSICLSEQAG